jgi:hypothetical protein
MFVMSPARMAVWIFGVAVLGAWLAAAAGVSGPVAPATTAPAAPAPNSVDHLAADVQAQAVRLRQRLDAAPAPQTPLRNPFTFSAPQPTAARTVRTTPAPAYVPPPVEPEPMLLLVGIAEKKTGEGSVRTAMISNDRQDLIMVTAGQRILGLYDVVAIGLDAVELKHVTTGAPRFLALR